MPASLTGLGAAVWVGVFYIFGNLLFASFQVPYLTTPSDLNVSYYQRTRVATYRMVVLTVGLLGAGVAAPRWSGPASAVTTRPWPCCCRS